MKKAIIFSTVIVLVLTTTVSGQSLKFGVTGGLNFAQMKFNDVATQDVEMESVKDRSTGYHIGVVGQAGLLSFFVQPSLLFTNTKSEVDIIENNEVSREEISFNRFDVPILVGKKFAGIVKVMAGPVGSFQLSSDSPLNEAAGIEDDYNAATVGYQAGVGLEAANLFVEFKFEGNLSKMGDGITVGGTEHEFDSRMNQMIVSVGLLF